MDYWNSTAELTGTGRPVDAVISPLAPFAAAIPEKYLYYGYSGTVNVLDYTSCTIPVTVADKEVDVVKDFKPLSDQDRKVMDSCEFGVRKAKWCKLMRSQMIRISSMELMLACK